MAKPISEFILDELKDWKTNLHNGNPAYKVNQDRLNFLYKAHDKCGRDHVISETEVKLCKLYPLI
jgi:hypothetical protein